MRIFLGLLSVIYIALSGALAGVIVILGVGLVVYVALWVMLLGGFADAINLFKTSSPVSAGNIAAALAKILFAIPVGFLIGSITYSIFDKIRHSWALLRSSNIPMVESDDERMKRIRREMGYDNE